MKFHVRACTCLHVKILDTARALFMNKVMGTLTGMQAIPLCTVLMVTCTGDLQMAMKSHLARSRIEKLCFNCKECRKSIAKCRGIRNDTSKGSNFGKVPWFSSEIHDYLGFHLIAPGTFYCGIVSVLFAMISDVCLNLIYRIETYYLNRHDEKRYVLED